MNRSISKRLSPGILLTAFLLIGLFLRLLHTFDMRASPVFDRPAMDPGYHDQWARSIVAGDPITSGEAYFRAPLYPYLLAAVYKIGGGDPVHPRLVQAFLGLLTLYLAYRIGRRLFGTTSALLAVFLALLYPGLLYFEGELLIEPLAVFLDVALLLVLLLAEEKRRARFWLASGFLLGLSAITRPNILLVAPAIPIWLLLRGRGDWLRRVAIPTALVAAGAIVAIAPVTVRNLREGGDLVWIASQGGINFYLGNNPGADGWSATAPGIRKDWWGGIEDSYLIAKKDLGRDPKPSEVSSYWYDRGRAYLLQNPAEGARLFLRKIYLLLQGRELSNNYIIDFACRYSRPFRLLPLSFGLIVPLALLGIASGWRDRRRAVLLLFVAFYSVSIVLFFVCSRYRMPLVPILLLYAAAGLLRLGGAIRRRSRSAIPMGAGVVLLAFLLNHDFGAIGKLDWTLGYLGEGVSYLERGDPKRAAERFREALRLTPGSSEAEHDLGVALREMGDQSGAIASFRRALVLDPANPEALNNLALTLAAAGRSDEAFAAYREGITLDPRNPGLRVNLAQLLQAEQRWGEAAAQYRAFLASGARDGRVNANLGTCLVQQGEAEEGEREMRRGVEISPDLPGPVLLLAEHLVAAGRPGEARALLAEASLRMPGEAALTEALHRLETVPDP